MTVSKSQQFFYADKEQFPSGLCAVFNCILYKTRPVVIKSVSGENLSQNNVSSFLLALKASTGYRVVREKLKTMKFHQIEINWVNTLQHPVL